MKLKSTNLVRGVFAWFCFLLCAFSIIAGLIFAIYYGRSIFDEGSYFFTEIGQALSGDLRETDTYKENASALFERLYYSTQGDTAANSNAASDEDADENAVASSSYHYYVSRDETGTTVSTVYVESISKDDLYSVTSYSTDPAGKTVTNDSNWDAQTLPEGFNYLFICEEGVVRIYHSDKDGALDCVFSSDTPGAVYTNTLSYTLEALRQSSVQSPKISFAVRTEPTSYYSSNEIVSAAQLQMKTIYFYMGLIMAAVIMFVLVLLFSILFRQDRKLFERYIAHGLKWIWIEIKVIAVFVWAFVVLNIISYGFDLTGTVLCVLFARHRYFSQPTDLSAQHHSFRFEACAWQPRRKKIRADCLPQIHGDCRYFGGALHRRYFRICVLLQPLVDGYDLVCRVLRRSVFRGCGYACMVCVGTARRPARLRRWNKCTRATLTR